MPNFVVDIDIIKDNYFKTMLLTVEKDIQNVVYYGSYATSNLMLYQSINIACNVIDMFL